MRAIQQKKYALHLDEICTFFGHAPPGGGASPTTANNFPFEIFLQNLSLPVTENGQKLRSNKSQELKVSAHPAPTIFEVFRWSCHG